MPAPDAAALLRRNGSSADTADRPAIRFGDEVWTHAERWRPRRFAGPTSSSRSGRPGPPRTGDRSTSACCWTTRRTTCSRSAGAAFAGATVVGLNPTQGGRAPGPRHRPHRHRPRGDRAGPHRRPGRHRPRGPARPRVAPLLRRSTSTAGGPDDLDDALAEVGDDDPGLDHDPDTRWVLVFTSGHVGRAEGGDLLAAAHPRHRHPHGDHDGPRVRTTSATSRCRCSTPTR